LLKLINCLIEGYYEGHVLKDRTHGAFVAGW